MALPERQQQSNLMWRQQPMVGVQARVRGRDVAVVVTGLLPEIKRRRGGAGTTAGSEE